MRRKVDSCGAVLLLISTRSKQNKTNNKSKIPWCEAYFLSFFALFLVFFLAFFFFEDELMNFIRLKKFGTCPKFQYDFTYANQIWLSERLIHQGIHFHLLFRKPFTNYFTFLFTLLFIITRIIDVYCLYLLFF